MIKRGKQIVFGCSLLLAIGLSTAMFATDVLADTETTVLESKEMDANMVGLEGETLTEEAAEVVTSSEEGEVVIETTISPEPTEVTASQINELATEEIPIVEKVVTAEESSPEIIEEPVVTNIAPLISDSVTVNVDSLPEARSLLANATELEAMGAVISYLVEPTVENQIATILVTYANGETVTINVNVVVQEPAPVTPQAVATRAATTDTSTGNSISDDRAITSEIQNDLEENAIYSPGVVGDKQTYAGIAYVYRNGSMNLTPDQNEDAVPLGGTNVYLQWVNGKGYVSKTYYTTSNADGTFVIDLSKPEVDANGASHEFILAGDGDFSIRTWVQNPDPSKYSVVLPGDKFYGFHDRLERAIEAWDFTAGVNRIVDAHVALQELPNAEEYLHKAEADRQVSPSGDGVWANTGIYGTIRGNVWYESGDLAGSPAFVWYKSTHDVDATGVKMVASYLNDEVTNLLDAWKTANPNYTLDMMRAAQAQIIGEYEAANGAGSHIAETVEAVVDADGKYYIPFRGLYGVSSTQQNSGLSISHTITDEEYGTLVRDEDVTNSNLMVWNGTIGQKHRHINADYVYVSPVISNYAVWSENFQNNTFESVKDINVDAHPSYNTEGTDFALVAPQPMHDVLVKDTVSNYGFPGDVVESRTGGLLPNREYQIQWFRDGVAYGAPMTVVSGDDGTAVSYPITVPDDLTGPTVFTSAVFRQGESVSNVTNALAADSFIANVPVAESLEPSYEEKVVTPGNAATSLPTLVDANGAETTVPEKTNFSIDPNYVDPAGYVVEIHETTGEVKVTAPATPTADTAETVEVPVIVTYPDGSTDTTVAKFLLDTDRDGTPDVTDTDDDGDGIPDTEEATDGTNPKDPNSVDSAITPIDDQTGVVGEPIKPVPVEVVKVPTDGSVTVDGLPDGVTYDPTTGEITGTPTTPGTSTVTVTVRDKDGNPVKDSSGNPVEETFTFTVTETPTDADKNTPEGKDQTVGVGETPKAEDSISNLPELPEGTEVEFKDPIDTTTPGEKDGTVVVTYPDGSTDEVQVKVIVKENPTDADKNTPEGKDQTVGVGETPKAEDSISNLPELPEGTEVEFKDPIDTTTPGEKDGTVVVTYPDGSTDEVQVKVIVKENPTDADKNTPEGKDQTVGVGETPKAEDSISNLPELPEGTEVEFKDPIDTTTPGEKDGTVVVTYPDGSKDEVPVKVTVYVQKNGPGTATPELPTLKISELFTPESKDQEVTVGNTPNAEDSITNFPDLPAGTTVDFKDPIDTTTPGEKDATIIVTYPDGSTDEVPVKVTVYIQKNGPGTATPELPTLKISELFTPESKDQTVNVGDTPNAEDSITNFPDLPAGTTVDFKDPIDTTTPGEKDATVIVTYPDGSTDEVPVKVTVYIQKNGPGTATPELPTLKISELFTPESKDQTVNVGDTPNAEDSITNFPDLPAGTTVDFKDPIDTTTPGEKDATVIVTYPDGSTDEVPVKVMVKDPTTRPTDTDNKVPISKVPVAAATAEKARSTQSKVLPNTGQETNLVTVGAGIGLLLASLSCFGFASRKRKKESDTI
ncbi:LPXTG cell wall anchor domain-containing protein [Streptococcus suis]|nr:LPXTG cell wall anchor domain-containing protein [Streptococcus suis]